MKQDSLTDLALLNYNFKKERPVFTSGNYNVYVGTQN